MTSPKVRDCYFYRARKAARGFVALAKPGQKVVADRRRRQSRQEQGGDCQRLRGGVASTVAGSRIKCRNADAKSDLGGALAGLAAMRGARAEDFSNLSG